MLLGVDRHVALRRLLTLPLPFLLLIVIAALDVPSIARAACPNETLRSENGSLALPDCRAYERVTPSTKNGFRVGRYAEPFVGDGPRVETEALATFGGTESAFGLGASYEFTRSESSGWQTTPLYPPASQFERVDFTTPLYALGTDGRSLLGLGPVGSPSDEENFYIGQGSSAAEIGPEVPPTSLIGKTGQQGITSTPNFNWFAFQLATPDLSHVVYELFSPGEHNYLWPFDQTGEGFLSSTYEYTGVGQAQPFLVGVTGGPGSSELISGCGTSVGSLYSQDSYNAMSADGSVVFFTPWSEEAVGACSSALPEPTHTELWARVAGETAAAHTVDISEPSPSDCSACDTSAPQAATFQGASEDGSKVFFLTEQELLPGNPGDNLYEYNFAAPVSERVTAVSHLASEAAAGVLGVVRVSEDGSHVYFVATAELTAEPNSVGAVARAGEDNLYAYDSETGATKFVATLAPGDAATWSTTDIERQAEATPEGRFLLFASTADLTPDDTSSVSQLFRYDFDSGELVRVSVGQEGFNEDGNTDADPVTIPRQIGKYAYGQYGPTQKWMSDDGQYIFFESTKALTPQAIEHYEIPGTTGSLVENVYEWHDGAVSLISDGRDRGRDGEPSPPGGYSAVRLLATTGDGHDVFFTTASPLVPGDRDQNVDIYDARVDGGLPQGVPGSCSGESCQGIISRAPVEAAAGSAKFGGPGNPTPPRKKRKHRKRHSKHHKLHKKKHRSARRSTASKPGHRKGRLK